MKEVRPEKGLTEEALDGCPSDTAPVEEAFLTAEQAREIDSITLMRIYDMLGAILTHLDEDAADALIEAHKAGIIIGPPPYIDMQAPEDEQSSEAEPQE